MPVAAIALTALAWVGLWLAATAGGGSELYVSSMSVGTTVGSLAIFLAAWEVMVVAMMFPSSIGFLRVFRVVTGKSRYRSLQRIGVCSGYALTWLCVGCLVMLVGFAVYRGSHVELWLSSHANLLAGGVLALAGGFQFTTLKRRCLAICGQPATFLMRHYRRGAGNAFVLGLRFGLVCAGCCWSLMLIMIMLGGGSLLLMMLLTSIMFAERTAGWDNRFVRLVGLASIVLGVTVIATPGAVPALAHNAGSWIEMNSVMHMTNHDWLPWCRA
jgi:predicted metal-binding membrane protein